MSEGRRGMTDAEFLAAPYKHRQRLSVRERFESFVIPDPNSGCFVWFGYTDRHGYAQFSLRNRNLQAHRVAWFLDGRSIPDGKWLLHKCDFPLCVNPDHMFVGDCILNHADMALKGRGSRGPLPFGVFRSGTKFCAGIKIHGRRKHLGSFTTIDEAAAAALAAKRSVYA